MKPQNVVVFGDGYEKRFPDPFTGLDPTVTLENRDRKDLFEHCYYAGPESNVGELLKAAGRLEPKEFRVADLIRETGWRKSKTYDVLTRAEELGCIADGPSRGHYVILRPQVESPLSLPAKVKLSANDFRISTRIRS